MVVTGFRYFVKESRCQSLIDNNRWLIDGNLAVNYFIRFENLAADIQKVCQHLAIDADVSKMPHEKPGNWHKDLSVADYYDAETFAIVEDAFSDELARFNYSFDDCV